MDPGSDYFFDFFGVFFFVLGFGDDIAFTWDIASVKYFLSDTVTSISPFLIVIDRDF